MTTMQIAPNLVEDDRAASLTKPCIALVTPYNGGNLGDAAIQHSMISNLRLHIPGAQFLGITLNCENFLRRHGEAAFPLLASMTSPRTVLPANSSNQTEGARESFAEQGNAEIHRKLSPVRRALRSVPGLAPLLRRVRAWTAPFRREIVHCFEGYRVLRTQDLLILSGGGQLDEEYGGAWRLPFAFFKWTLLARLARVPCAIASVGAGSIKLSASRRFISIALRACCYRSFREERSRSIVAKFFPRATNDSIVPDLAFSLPDSELPPGTGIIRRLAYGRPVVVLSPISYAKPGSWPTPDRALYDRYVRQMAHVVSHLSRRGHLVVIACSSLGDDETVIPDLMEHVDEDLKGNLEGQVYFPSIGNWRDFVATLRDSDYLIASRLHGTILGFVTQTPVVAISFDPKVDWVMEDLNQSESLLHFRDFNAEDVLRALESIKSHKETVVSQISGYRQKVISTSDSTRQYAFLAGLALNHHQCRN